ncbi:root phototropism protein 2-like [Tasmannia lanceolata]|uniref:root phototropism protein 2-like n=1 Tax=Tasmannia lanceolata TaxID=3420 RepID=UPI004064AC85
MAVTVKNSRLSMAMERTGQWVFSQEIPSDVVVEVDAANFSLHKFMLVAKSGYIRKIIVESEEPDLTRIVLSDIPGGPEFFEKAAKFCYGVNFEITVHNVAALRCIAEYLQMTEKYCEGNLANRTEEFLHRVALTSFSGAIAVLRSCEDLLPMAEELKIVQKCVEVASVKACTESNFPTRSPPEWWIEELALLSITSLKKIITSMKSHGAKTQTLASVIITYSERSLRDLVRQHTSASGTSTSDSDDPDIRSRQKTLLESIISLLPSEKSSLPVSFLCCLLRAAIFLNSSMNCKNDIERRISAVLEHVSIGDLLVLSFTYDGERLFDLDSVRRIISGFVERERSGDVFNRGGEGFTSSVAMQKVARICDAYLAEIASDDDLSISKFTGIANLVPKGARKVDDDLYRAVDIYLKTHPGLDEIEREKVCSVMDPLKLSYEARVHASQNKRLPVQIVLHALYYDQLKLRSGPDEASDVCNAVTTRQQIQADVSLIKENEALRSELTRMKLYISDAQKNNGALKSSKRPKFFSSFSKTLGKLNPFRHGSKDTLSVDEGADLAKPRRRRFSIS